MNTQQHNHRLISLLLGASVLSLMACPGPVVGAGSTTAGTDDTGAGTGGEMADEYRRYFIGESVTFDGGGTCNNTELNTITSTLRDELDDAGWEGLRFVGANSWAEDFQDPSTNPLGLDGVYGDTARLAMYAGHGNVGLLQWGTPSGNGTCQMSIPQNARLGTLAGNRTAAMMFMTSCTLRTDALAQTLIANASRQFFGYHNSPYIGYDEPRKVFKRTADGQSTTNAWLDEMEQNADVGKNSPVVVTFGTSPQDAYSHHQSTNLASGEGLITNVGEPADNFIFTWYNNGCTPGCGNCNPAPPPSLPVGVGLGSTVPLVQLERMTRSEAKLVEELEFLLPFFGVDSTSVVTQGRLASWAHTASTDGEVTFAEICQNPRITVSYDPVEDRLRVTDEDALKSAHLSFGQATTQPLPNQVTLADLQLMAEQVRNLVQGKSPTETLTIAFSTSTREVGYLDLSAGVTNSTPVEYRFEVTGRVQSLNLPGRSLRIGVTRLGELSSITSSGMHAEVVGAELIVRTPATAMAEFEAALLAQYPDATAVEFFDVSIGYALPEESSTTVAEPSVLLRYALTFEDSAGVSVVSRSEPVSLSLVSSCLRPVLLSTQDPNPTPGDARRAG